MDLEKNYLKAVKRILSALCGGFIKRGVTLPVVVSILKEAIVQAAVDQSENDNGLTNSRISVMTGVHRKDISAIRGAGNPKTQPKSLNARVIAQWMGNPKFLQADGSPAVLKKSGVNSFEELIVSVSKDIRPRTVLDEWSKREYVSINNDEITLNIQNYMPSGSEDESLYFFGENLADHIAVCTNNITNIENRLFERVSYADSLSAESIKKLEAIVHDRAMTMLIDINKIALQMVQEDSSKKVAKYRYKFGTYFYQSNSKNRNLDHNSEDKKTRKRKRNDSS